MMEGKSASQQTLHLTEVRGMELASTHEEPHWAKWGKNKTCPKLASILSHENLTLPYYCDSLPLQGNGSVVCRITESGNALDQCRGSLFGTQRTQTSAWVHCEKSVFVFSLKKIKIKKKIKWNNFALSQSVTRNCRTISPSGACSSEIWQSNQRQAARGNRDRAPPPAAALLVSRWGDSIKAEWGD